MPTITVESKIEEYTEQLMRMHEFHQWLNTNCLFPQVPDSIVNPLRAEVIKAEHLLVARLYDLGATDRVVMIEKTLQKK